MFCSCFAIISSIFAIRYCYSWLANTLIQKPYFSSFCHSNSSLPNLPKTDLIHILFAHYIPIFHALNFGIVPIFPNSDISLNTGPMFSTLMCHQKQRKLIQPCQNRGSLFSAKKKLSCAAKFLPCDFTTVCVALESLLKVLLLWKLCPSTFGGVSVIN